MEISQKNIRQAFSSILGENISNLEEGYIYSLYDFDSETSRMILQENCEEDSEMSFFDFLESSEDIWGYEYSKSLYSFSEISDAIKLPDIINDLEKFICFDDFIKGENLAKVLHKHNYDVMSLVESFDPFPPTLIAKVKTDGTLFNAMVEAHNIESNYSKLNTYNFYKKGINRITIDQNYKNKMVLIEDEILRYHLGHYYTHDEIYGIGYSLEGKELKKSITYKLFNSMENYKIFMSWESTTKLFIVQEKI